MFKFTLALLLVAGTLGTAPAFADTNSGGSIGRGCTLNPFNHTMRCIDFDHCSKNSKGEQVCPTTVTSTRKAQ